MLWADQSRDPDVIRVGDTFYMVTTTMHLMPGGATSLKYHDGKFYALLAPNERGKTGDTYIFTADKAEGPWTLLSRMRHFHDCSLFFDDPPLSPPLRTPPLYLPPLRGENRGVRCTSSTGRGR